LAKLSDAGAFDQIAPDEWRRGVMFAGDDNLTSSDNLRDLATKQTGEYSHQRMVAQMHHQGLSPDTSAEALRISPRILRTTAAANGADLQH